MTGIILIFVAVFEIAFTIYCLRTKTNQTKIKSYVRFFEFTIFLLLCMLNIMEWGMRWYPLGALVFVLSIKGAYALISKRRILKQFRPGRQIIKAVAMILLFAVTLIPAFLFPQYQVQKPTGNYQVGTAEFTYTSDTITDYFSGGKRQVNVGFWYPKNGSGRYPLLIFSHGAFGIKNSNISAFENLASHGYVVCSIDHPGHSFYTESADGTRVIVDKAYINEVMNSNKDTYYTKAECYELIKKWMKIRTEDINLTIDTILQYVAEGNVANTIEPQQVENMKLYQSIDRSKIGVFGHSMGAAASVQIGRERKDVGAVINIDGPYFSEITYDSNLDEYVALGEQYSTPILNIYSDQVWVQLQDGTDTGTYAANKISKKICQESYDVYLKGTKHLTLTDLALASPFLSYLLNGEADEVDAKKSIELENKLILEFFNATLKGEGEFTSEGSYEQ